jgi:hypothetical protein
MYLTVSLATPGRIDDLLGQSATSRLSLMQLALFSGSGYNPLVVTSCMESLRTANCLYVGKVPEAEPKRCWAEARAEVVL